MAVASQRGSVLVVDDDATVLQILSAYLQRAGYATRVAGDGVEALGLAAEQRPDLVVLDLMLPGLNGLDVMRRLREHGDLSVILLSAKGEPGDRVTELRLGADDYVPKPFSPAELVARVDAVLRRVDRSPEASAPSPSTASRSTATAAAGSCGGARPRSPSASSTCCCSSRATRAGCSRAGS